MCGIIGYVGSLPAKKQLLQGLKMLEYRGYDSAGICCFEKGELKVIKKKGKVEVLSTVSQSQLKTSTCGIGHTRWATHGDPSDKNSHPFLSENNNVAIVHNGIIENFEILKGQLQKEGMRFRSQTDSEVIAYLLQKSHQKSELEKVRELSHLLKGSYAVAILFKEHQNQIFAIKKDSPLIVGKGENGFYLSSDVNALLNNCQSHYVMQENEIVWMDNEDCYVFDQNLKSKDPNFEPLDFSNEDISLGHYEHFMLKELLQVPVAIKNTIGELNSNVNAYAKLPKEMLKNVQHISIIGCGTAYNAGLTAQHYARERNLIVDCFYASEYRYQKFVQRPNEICIFISQSGETADTIEALKLAKSQNIVTFVISNVPTSTINKLADFIIPTKAGPEIAVASTKAYNAQLTALYVLFDIIYCIKNNLNCKDSILKEKINDLIKKMQNYNLEIADSIASILNVSKTVFFIGRGVDYATSQEASLKLKEISSIHSESLYAGELKHGTLALIDENTTVLVTATQKNLFEKTMNSIYEIKARGATVVLLTQFDVENDALDLIVKLPCTDQCLMPLVSIYPLQMIAYKTALLKGLDPDKPRNLAKSVTVE